MAETTGQSILIVEDDQKVANIMKSHLEFVGFEVHAESRGTAALTYAAEHRPALVILDIKLPDLDGNEVCKELRKLYHRWDVPILMLTAMDAPSAQLRGFAHGADAYLTKPYEARELLGTIALLLGHTVAN